MAIFPDVHPLAGEVAVHGVSVLFLLCSTVSALLACTGETRDSQSYKDRKRNLRQFCYGDLMHVLKGMSHSQV